MQQNGSGKANRCSHLAFAPRAQHEMLPLQLLGPPLPDLMAVGSQVPAMDLSQLLT